MKKGSGMLFWGRVPFKALFDTGLWDNFVMLKYFKKGFTLAEVLITLGIIGIVAAMTIPSLTGKTNSKQLQTSFKLAYAQFTQATRLIAEEEGPGLWEKYIYHDENNKDAYYPRAGEIVSVYKSKFKVIGKCNYWFPVKTYDGSQKAYIDRGSTNPPWALANGMCMEVMVNAAQINITVDINGTSAPNRLGYDIFYFDIDRNDNLHPKKTTKLYTEEELEKYKDNTGAATLNQLGDPCSKNNKQPGNGLGCAGWAYIDKNPDDPTKGYWESLK